MPLPLYVVDAFTTRPFSGNPAAVCPLTRWLDPRQMQSIAAENALSETAFFVRRPDGDFDLRWFTPATEIELCGHATLASGFVVLRWLEPERAAAAFHTRSGKLTVSHDGERLAMELPRRAPRPFEPTAELQRALGQAAVAWLRGQYIVAVLADERAVRTARPDLAHVDALSITAPGDDCDFVSRFFAPAYGIAEDPVTGSAHCSLVPYWSERLGRSELFARQVSARGGELHCRDQADSVCLRGACALYSRGQIEIEAQFAD